MLVSVILTNEDTMISACWVVNPKQTHEDNHTQGTLVVNKEKKNLHRKGENTNLHTEGNVWIQEAGRKPVAEGWEDYGHRLWCVCLSLWTSHICLFPQVKWAVGLTAL